MDGLNQQFRMGKLKRKRGVDGLMGKLKRKRGVDGQRQRQKLKSKQDEKRGETSMSMGSALLPEPSQRQRRLSGSTDHQQQQRLPCLISYQAGHKGYETATSCFSPFEQRYATCNKEIPWIRRILPGQFGTCHPYIVALLPGPNSLRIALLNPISGHEIKLPGSPISLCDFEDAPCFALSLPHSSPPCYTVFATFKCSQSKLLFYRKGDRDWTLQNLPWNIDDCFNTFRGDLYALRASEEARYLLAFYTTHPIPKFQKFCMDTSQLPSPKIHHSFEYHLEKNYCWSCKLSHARTSVLDSTAGYLAIQRPASKCSRLNFPERCGFGRKLLVTVC